MSDGNRVSGLHVFARVVHVEVLANFVVLVAANPWLSQPHRPITGCVAACVFESCICRCVLVLCRTSYSTAPRGRVSLVNCVRSRWFVVFTKLPHFVVRFSVEGDFKQ